MVVRIEFVDDKRNTFTIEYTASQHYRLQATNGSGWREWTASSDEIPNILTFVRGFTELAETMIGHTYAH